MKRGSPATKERGPRAVDEATRSVITQGTREAESTATALIPTIWRAHDELEDLLSEATRLAGIRAEVLADPRIARAIDQAWQAHDLLERATLTLHGVLPKTKLTALQARH